MENNYLESSTGRLLYTGRAVIIFSFDVTVTVRDIRAVYFDICHFGSIEPYKKSTKKKVLK